MPLGAQAKLLSICLQQTSPGAFSRQSGPGSDDGQLFPPPGLATAPSGGASAPVSIGFDTSSSGGDTLPSFDGTSIVASAGGGTVAPSGATTGSALASHVPSVVQSAADDTHSPERHDERASHGTSLHDASSVIGRWSRTLSTNENWRRATMQFRYSGAVQGPRP